MKIIGIIPSRYASTRFPAKSLAVIQGKSMIQRVYEQAQQSSALNTVIVATDHQEIYTHVRKFGGQVCMTRADHVSGTDRCFEALGHQHNKYDYIINIQGDEPFIQPGQIDLLAGQLDGVTEIATLVKALQTEEQLFNPNVVKVVLSTTMEALYFSRSPIPHIRSTPESEWLTRHKFYKHIGMYAYRSDVLERLTRLSVSSLEKAESLEQLRWLQYGFRIRVAETLTETIGIDTPDDLQKAIDALK
ncbi:MAG TPA: 3-deoxy-manno-octulosonate cytidylyltransferase [Chryseolinea sp.]